MSSNSKRRKLYKEQNTRQRKNFEDRLTDLPSSLRTKILSCLSTKDAVKTSILSKEWKRSWTSVTNLDFDDGSSTRAYNYNHFVSFVYRVLLLHDRSCLQTFRMKCSKRYEGSLINAWIAAALLSTVKELCLFVPVKEDDCLLPCDIFLCKTLVVLKLDTSFNVNIPASVSLPDLKTLYINLRISDDVSFASLLSGCPALEELRLSFSIRKDVHVLNINSPALTSLTLESLIYWISDDNYNCQVVIDTPSLKYLNFSYYSAHSYVFKKLNNLIKAEINGTALEEDKEEETTGLLTDLFVGISQVQSLVLSHNAIEDINWCQVAVPSFSNLTYLEIDYAPKKLLENSPCLQTLHLRKGFSDHEHEHCLLIDDVPPSCFLSHLKVIRVDCFGGCQGEMEMVEYFLKVAKVLEKLILHYRPLKYNLREETRFLKKLVMLPRASTICKVEVL